MKIHNTRNVALTFLLAVTLALPLSAKEKVKGKKAIEITGQSRNFNMMLILKTKKDGISFVKVRKNYKKEILSTEP